MKTDIIKLNGMTERQCFLADILWQCQDIESVRRFVNALPTQELRNEAGTIVKLILLETIDQKFDGSSLAAAKQLIKRIK